MKIARKIKITLLACAVIGGVGFWWVDRSLRNFGEALEAHTFTDYVSRKFFPKTRKSSGKWPQNLNGLEAFLSKNDDQMVRVVARCYRTQFEKFELIRQSPQQISYRLKLKKYDVICVSHTDDEKSFCDYR